MTYIDGIIAPVAAGRKEDFRAAARESARLFLEYGALHVSDGFGMDAVPEGKRTDLWRAVAADKAGGEGIAFGWVVWPSKQARDAAWEGWRPIRACSPSPIRRSTCSG